MLTWKERPKEIANLLNPAICCTILTSSIVGYKSVDPNGMPFPLMFIVLPLILHKKTRDSLPRSITTTFTAWIHRDPSAKLSFYERAVSMKPFTREAISFGLSHGWLFLDQNGKMNSIMEDKNIERFLRKLDGENKECVRKSRLMGKLFAKAGSTDTIFTLLGIRK